MATIGSTEDIIYRFMQTLIRFKIASQRSECWGIESYYELQLILERIGNKRYLRIIEDERIKRRLESIYPHLPQSHRLVLAQELSQLKNTNQYPLICLTDSS